MDQCLLEAVEGDAEGYNYTLLLCGSGAATGLCFLHSVISREVLVWEPAGRGIGEPWNSACLCALCLPLCAVSPHRPHFAS